MEKNNLSWVFQTSIGDWAKYFLNKMHSSKYVVKGSCKMCGECCKNILFSDENGYIKTDEEFEALKKRNRRYNLFEIYGKLEENGALLFKCKVLKENNKCGNYFFRSLYCRDYPSVNSSFIAAGGETLDGCGYYFDVNKKFSEYLK